MKKILTVLVFASIAAAYLAGYWPEHQRRVAAETLAAAHAAKLASAEGQVRLAQIEGQLLALIETVEAQNYGSAQRLASAFFDAAQTELARQPDAGGTAALTAVLGVRDRVTASLIQADPKTLELLEGALDGLRGALGQPRRPALAEPPPVS
jgi:hypothetical protein